MNYLQYVYRNLRRGARAELPCVGSIEASEGSVAAYLGTIGTVSFGLIGAAFFIGWERYGERYVLGEESNEINNENSYKRNPMKALAYDAKRAFTSDLPRIGKALYLAPVHIGRTMMLGNWKDRVKVVKDIVSSLWTGLTAELLAYVPASIVIERLIPVGKGWTTREPEYWLLWFAALGAGLTVGTVGIALKLGFDDYRKGKSLGNAKL